MTEPTEKLANQMDELRALAAAATPGPWEALDPDDGGWWWVWRKGVPHYAGVMHVDQAFDKDGEWSVGGHIGAASITDGSNVAQERADAEYIAAVSPDVVLALLAAVGEVAALRQQVERLRGENAGLLSDFRSCHRQHLQKLDELARAEAERDQWEQACGEKHYLYVEARDERDALQARLTAVLALCGSFDPTSGSGRAQAFVGDIRAAASGQEG